MVLIMVLYIKIKKNKIEETLRSEGRMAKSQRFLEYGSGAKVWRAGKVYESLAPSIS